MIVFKAPPTQQEMEAFAYDWLQVLGRRDYPGATDMLRHSGRPWAVELLRLHIEETLTFYKANAVRVPSRDALVATVAYEYRGARRDAEDTRVGYVHFSLFVDGDMVDDAISMWLHKDPEGFTLELEDIHVW